MKILFFPYYYYLQYEPFYRVMLALKARGVETQLIYIPNISPKDETNSYNPGRFSRDGILFEEFRLLRFRRSNDKPAPVSQSLQYLSNFFRLKKFIRQMKPDCVVIGSHLGGIYIRALQVICHDFSIPCFSFWGIEVEARDAIALPRYLPMPPLLKGVLQWPPVNVYTQTHKFAVTGNMLKRHLLKKGIRESQIVVTGNPVHDQIGKRTRSKLSEAVHCGKGEEKYVVLLTQPIQEIFGLEYLEMLLKSINAALDELPLEIRVIVKFHPRETAQSKALHQNIFAGSRYTFLEEADLFQLIAEAELSIGYFTKALETSFILGVPVLAINFTGLPQYTVYPNHGLMECRTPEEVQNKLASFFSDAGFRLEAYQSLKAWLADNVCGLDGENTARMAEAIIAQAGEHRRGLCGSYSPA